MMYLNRLKRYFFSRKTDKINYMPLTFNAIPVTQTSHQKHLGLYLDEKLNFKSPYKRNYLRTK